MYPPIIYLHYLLQQIYYMRIAVIGAGHIGTIHAKIYSKLNNVQLVAICDIDKSREQLAHELKTTFTTNYKKLPTIDAVSITTPTKQHHEIGLYFLKQNIPCLIEKPLTNTIKESEELCKYNNILQVGHIERFNPAIRAAHQYVNNPWFIKTTRTSPYQNRSTEISVILDLMIHDIDLITSILGEPSDITANGISIISTTEDIVNAHLKFPNGASANIMVSRISHQKERKMQIFQKDNYLSLDLLNGCGTYIKIEKNTKELKQINLINDGIGSLDMELLNFIKNIQTNTKPIINGKTGLNALRIAHKIISIITENNHKQH